MSSASGAAAAQIIVRKAPPDFTDWEPVRALILDAFAYMEARINPPSSALRLTAKSMNANADKGGLFLAERGADLVGCVFAQVKGDVLYIGKLAVRPGLQGSGIGKKLVDATREEARRRSIGILELETRIELVENHATFARMGFVKTGESAHEGFDRPTSITMRAKI